MVTPIKYCIRGRFNLSFIYLEIASSLGWALWRAPVIQLLWKPGLVDRLSSGVLYVVALWRSGVHAKLGTDMVSLAEAMDNQVV